MIKFVVGKEDVNESKMIGIGLTEPNLELLRSGKPILFKLKEVMGGGIEKFTAEDEVFIFHGKDEQTILEYFQKRGLVTDRTVVNDSRPKQ